MRNVLIVFGFSLGLFSCTSSVRVDELRSATKLYAAKASLWTLADTTNTSDTNVSSLLNAFVIDEVGDVKPIKMNRAIEHYLENTRSTKTNLFPVFEVKNGSRVILPVTGKGLWGGIWGSVLLDKNNLAIARVIFDHDSETPGMGAEITKESFRGQFVGTEIKAAEKSFGLFQDGVELIKGQQRVDGISGATLTSQGVVQMLNNSLRKYQHYLESD